MSKIDQKEYLKKYLCGDKKKRKKKKEPQGEKVRVKIIDDDVDVVKSRVNYDDHIILTGEDAPQIVGIIDDRPPELKTIEDFQSSGKWKSFSKTGESSLKERKSQKKIRIKNDFSPERTPIFSSRSKSPANGSNVVKISDDDYSPPRKYRIDKGAGISTGSPSITKSKRDSDDYSPPRKAKKYHSPSSVRMEKDDDISPPRKRGSKDAISGLTSRESKPQKYSDEDLSPKRKVRRASGSDYSPPRRKRDEKSNGRKQSRWGESEKDQSHKERYSRRSQSFDFSPQRRKKENEFDRNNRHSKQLRPHGSSQGGSYRSSHRRRSEDLSPKRNRDDSKRKNTTTAPTRNVEDGDDFSPPRKSNTGERERKEKSSIAEKDKLKPSRTLDGKKAGLQDAKLLKEETDKLRKREDELFKKMSSEISGKDADIVVRNRRVKSAAELQKEEEKERERSKREQEKQEAYNRWGVGLKQIENYKTKVAEEMHESSKPLARYSDDADLDEMLKKQERQGDPMLQYIRGKTHERNKNNNAQILPTYKGPFPENRFNIRPGYRWDGVDRSTGYEKKWFDIQNQKKALQEEAYKYSVEDM